jgi:hypothetical protein
MLRQSFGDPHPLEHRREMRWNRAALAAGKLPARPVDPFEIMLDGVDDRT